MTNPLEDAADFFADCLADELSVSVTYTRGGTSESGIPAVVSNREYQLVDEDGVMTSLIMRDYDFRTSDLELSGSAITPRSGDRITESVQGTNRVYEVMPIPGGREIEEVDSFGYLLRVHTKQVG